jgi:hypothetical protein
MNEESVTPPVQTIPPEKPVPVTAAAQSVSAPASQMRWGVGLLAAAFLGAAVGSVAAPRSLAHLFHGHGRPERGSDRQGDRPERRVPGAEPSGPPAEMAPVSPPNRAPERDGPPRGRGRQLDGPPERPQGQGRPPHERQGDRPPQGPEAERRGGPEGRLGGRRFQGADRSEPEVRARPGREEGPRGYQPGRGGPPPPPQEGGRHDRPSDGPPPR